MSIKNIGRNMLWFSSALRRYARPISYSSKRSLKTCQFTKLVVIDPIKALVATKVAEGPS